MIPFPSRSTRSAWADGRRAPPGRGSRPASGSGGAAARFGARARSGLTSANARSKACRSGSWSRDPAMRFSAWPAAGPPCNLRKDCGESADREESSQRSRRVRPGGAELARTNSGTVVASSCLDGHQSPVSGHVSDRVRGWIFLRVRESAADLSPARPPSFARSGAGACSGRATGVPRLSCRSCQPAAVVGRLSSYRELRASVAGCIRGSPCERVRRPASLRRARLGRSNRGPSRSSAHEAASGSRSRRARLPGCW